MGFLEGKKGLILGVANDHSLAWGIARALHHEGAELGFTYVNEALERRVRPLAESVGSLFVEKCDVGSDEDIDALMARTREVFGKIDILVHAIAFAERDELTGPYLQTTRQGFLTAMEISAYSLTALVKAADPLLNPGASILTLSYQGARVVIPHYNAMGIAKAALEASVRYLAADLGPRSIRVNAISSGPVRTLASSGVAGFRELHRQFAHRAPLRRNVTIDDVGRTASWLCSDMSNAITGEVIYVDSGSHIVGVSAADLADGH